MAEWNPNPSWTPKEQINGGQSFVNLEDVSASDFNKLVENMQYLYANGGDFDMSNYPVGAVYISTVNTSPAVLFGGKWTAITDKFLLAAGSIYAAGSTGGSATVTLTSSQLPNHSHNITANLKTDNVYVDLSATSGTENAVAITGTTKYGSATLPTNKSGRLMVKDAESVPEARGEAHNNMPPYEAFYMWKRIA